MRTPDEGRSRGRRLFAALRDYLGGSRRGRLRRIDTPAALQAFLGARSSHVAQTALYGYLKARAGTRFPELFEHPTYLESINIAKWQVWLACLSDLSVYAGGLLAARAPGDAARVDRGGRDARRIGGLRGRPDRP